MPKFFAKIALGVWAIQSSTAKVVLSFCVSYHQSTIRSQITLWLQSLLGARQYEAKPDPA